MEDLFLAPLKTLLITGAYVLLYGGPLALLYITFWLLSLPLRRRERARLFLDLLEMGVNDGHSPEAAIQRAASSHDPVLGARFHLLAAHLESGRRLDEALHDVPRLLPPQVTAMLAVGAELGDIRRVLPACRQTLQDALSQMRGALNYLAILTFVVLPIVPYCTIVLSIYVVPKFELIAKDMGGSVPALSAAVFDWSGPFVIAQVAVMLFFQALMLGYIAGPRLRDWLSGLSFIIDRLHWALPWRRRRLQRDFATMLALLLDAGVPEPRAVALAAESAPNALFRRRAGRVADELAAGAKLTDAVRALDDSGEFRWRLANATHGRDGFLAALRGWFLALDARAFQQEQAAAQTLTTALVLWNGVVIGVFVVGMFQVLTNLITEAALW